MLESIFNSRVGTKILMHVGKSPYKEFYLNELSKELKIGLGRTKTILDNLSEQRVLSKKTSGNRQLFKLNTNNQLCFEIIKLANLDQFLKLPERFRTTLTKFTHNYKKILRNNLLSIVVFGSVAKGTAKRWSDMDIFILVKTKPDEKTRKFLEKTNYDISDTFSEVAQEIIYSEKDFIQNYKTGDDFLINIMRDGIILYDKDNFFSAYLSKGIPEITKKTIEKLLKFSKERLNECIDHFQKFPDTTASMLLGVSIHLSRSILLLNNIIPGSKHDIPLQLNNIGENKLGTVYKKTRKWFDLVHVQIEKDEIWEVISFLKEKYKKASKLLEDWK